jgi:hypothetical protein
MRVVYASADGNRQAYLGRFNRERGHSGIHIQSATSRYGAFAVEILAKLGGGLIHCQAIRCHDPGSGVAPAICLRVQVDILPADHNSWSRVFAWNMPHQ